MIKLNRYKISVKNNQIVIPGSLVLEYGLDLKQRYEIQVDKNKITFTVSDKPTGFRFQSAGANNSMKISLQPEDIKDFIDLKKERKISNYVITNNQIIINL